MRFVIPSRLGLRRGEVAAGHIVLRRAHRHHHRSGKHASRHLRRRHTSELHSTAPGHEPPSPIDVVDDGASRQTSGCPSVAPVTGSHPDSNACRQQPVSRLDPLDAGAGSPRRHVHGPGWCASGIPEMLPTVFPIRRIRRGDVPGNVPDSVPDPAQGLPGSSRYPSGLTRRTPSRMFRPASR